MWLPRYHLLGRDITAEFNFPEVKPQLLEEKLFCQIILGALRRGDMFSRIFWCGTLTLKMNTRKIMLVLY